MFSYLGIDLSEAFHSYRQIQAPLKRRIILRLVIIVSFLSGGIIGGLMFSRFHFLAFYVPIGLLFTALFYDYFRIKFTRAISGIKY